MGGARGRGRAVQTQSTREKIPRKKSVGAQDVESLAGSWDHQRRPAIARTKPSGVCGVRADGFHWLSINKRRDDDNSKTPAPPST